MEHTSAFRSLIVLTSRIIISSACKYNFFLPSPSHGVLSFLGFENLFAIYKAVEYPQCSLCKQFKESVLHLFCTCLVTRSLWAQFCVWASNANISLASDLDPHYCILGMYREELQDQVIVNHMILLVKCYIYLKRGDKAVPNLTDLKAYIKGIEKL